MAGSKRRAAHLLLSPELACSPPNEAIVSALLELGCEVDLFSIAGPVSTACYVEGVSTRAVEYGTRWLLKNAWSPAWRKYHVFSGTSEDPLAVAGVLSWLHGRPFFALDDEIKAGGYYGDAPESWKRLCRWAIRRARFNIVNDESRIQLLRDYSGVAVDADILVYPGCFREPPLAADRAALRRSWGIPRDALVIGISGGFNETSGADWVIDALASDSSIHLVVQALNMSPFSRLLFERIRGAERLYMEPSRLEWKEAWASAPACDIGVAIYTNPAPQFQNMGISSNRLCMFLAMGVPIITSRQDSFKFVEEYGCGVMVGSSEEFIAAVRYMRERLPEMKGNALRCAKEYINASGRYRQLKERIASALA